MAEDFTIKRHDRLPELTVALKDADDVVVNVTGASIRFIMSNKANNENAVDQTAEIVDGANGIVKYVWDEDDTDEAGTYNAEFEVEFVDGRLETFPNNRYIIIKIKEDLGGVE